MSAVSQMAFNMGVSQRGIGRDLVLIARYLLQHSLDARLGAAMLELRGFTVASDKSKKTFVVNNLGFGSRGDSRRHN